MNKKNDPNDPGAMMNPGEVRPIAEIEIGPGKHEKFLDQNYRKIALAVIAVILVATCIIVYKVTGDEERKESGRALSAAVSLGNGGLQINTEELDAIQQQYPSQNSAVTAKYLKAIALWKESKVEDGNAAMEAFIANAPDQLWKNQASAIYACHLMKAGKNEEAAKHFQTVVDNGNVGPYTPLALVSLGDIAAQAGDVQKAESYYNELIEKYPDSKFIASNIYGLDEVTLRMRMVSVDFRKDLLGVAAPEKVAVPEPEVTPADTAEDEIGIPADFALPSGQ